MNDPSGRKIIASHRGELCDIDVRADSIVEVRMRPEFYSGEQVPEVIRQIKKVGNKPHLLVLVLGEKRSMVTFTGLQAIFSQEAIDYSMAKAYVLKSYTQFFVAHVGRFFFKPKTPIRFFKTREKAETWLSTFQGYGI